MTLAQRLKELLTIITFKVDGGSWLLATGVWRPAAE